MLARITRTGIHANGLKNSHLFSLYTFRFLSAAPTHFLVDVLVHSLGFSRKEAVTTSTKNPMRITRNRGWIEDVIHRVEKDLGIPRESGIQLGHSHQGSY